MANPIVQKLMEILNNPNIVRAPGFRYLFELMKTPVAC